MSTNDFSDLARHDNAAAGNLSDHRPSDMEDEPLCEGEALLGAVSRMDNLAERQPPTSDRDTDRDCGSRYDNKKPSTSMASPVGTAATENNTASVLIVNGGIYRVKAPQAVIGIHVLPRYAGIEVQPNYTRELYSECVVRVIEDGFKEAPQLKQD